MGSFPLRARNDPPYSGCDWLALAASMTLDHIYRCANMKCYFMYWLVLR